MSCLFSCFSSLNKEKRRKKEKLHLVLHLDHTLLHGVKASLLSQKELANLTEEGRFVDPSHIDESGLSSYLIKLRPFLRDFLKEANKLFTMHVYTMRGHVYATSVLSIIDPNKRYFGDRVITCREKSTCHMKTLDLISADPRRVVIVDYTASVWPAQHKPNLSEIAKYVYYRDGMDSKEGSSYAEKRSDESRSNGALSNLLKLLRKAHTRFQEDLDSNNDLRLLIRDPPPPPCTHCGATLPAVSKE